MTRTHSEKLHGVVEGFYGLPWSPAQREMLFDWLRSFPPLSTYLYAPKDDFWHRQRWRELYAEPQAAALEELIAACAARGLRFIYAIAPGLDIRAASADDERALFAKVGQLRRLGCREFALLFDDVPARLDPADSKRFGSAGRAHADLSNRLSSHLRRRLDGELRLFCPTVYCSRQADFDLAGCAYLRDLAAELESATRLLWTGLEVISLEISRAHLVEVRRLLRHRIVLWDNLFANDYDLHRAFMGPFAGRDPALREEVDGILLNPNCELPLNFVPLHSFAAYLGEAQPAPAAARYAAATAAWQSRFGSCLNLEELRFLTDCFYLPHQLGPAAAALLEARAGGDRARLEAACARAEALYWRLATLEDRDLYHALRRYAWEIWNGLRSVTGAPTPSAERARGALVERLLRPATPEQ